MSEILRFEKVTKKFGKNFALSDIDFAINEGEFLFISGPSGAGKTTILKLILKQLNPDEGKIYFEGKDITNLTDKDSSNLRRKIGTVFQDFKVLPERTLRENIEVALAVVNVEKEQWKKRVDHVLELVGLSDKSELFPSQLAGGELQRVSLARALVVNPKIILADEATGNLDWDTAEKIVDLFKKINDEGKTVIMATHHQLIVKKLKKREISLNLGKIVKDTDPKPKQKIEKEKEDESGGDMDEKEKEKNGKDEKKNKD